MKNLLAPAQFYLELLKDKGIKDKEKFHPESSVLNHSLQAFYLACRRTSDIDLIMAALLHDIGKSFDSHNHPEIGAELLRNYYSPKTCYLIHNHLRIGYYLDGSMKKFMKKKELEEHPYFNLLITLREIDVDARCPALNLNLDMRAIEKSLKRVVLGRFGRKFIKG